jgi:hypothetical protein
MADKKISALTSATTPLAGTEVLPIVQSGTTVKVPVANLTSGRAVDMLSLTADTTTLVVDSTNHRAGVGTASPSKKLNVVIDAVASRQSLDAVDRTSQNLLTFTNPQYSTDASMGVLLRSFPQSDARQGAGIFSSGGGTNNTTDLNLFVSGLGGADVAYSAVSIDGNAGDATVRKGNIIQGTAAKGFNFTANTPAAGMTSQLLNWYEEGTWTPSLKFGGANTGWVFYGNAGIYGKYTRVGNLVTVTGGIGILTVGSATGAATITGLPFTSLTTGVSFGGGMNVTPLLLATSATFYVSPNTTTMILQSGAGAALTNANFGAYTELHFSFSYQV